MTSAPRLDRVESAPRMDSSRFPDGCMGSCCFQFLSSPQARSKIRFMSQDFKRTSASVFRLRCTERTEIGQSLQHPVKLVIFDFDETLTLVTMMTPDGTYLPEQREWAREVNFESPWVEGSRVEKLHSMLSSLANGKDGETRVLACLTRNGNSAGVAAVVNLMKAADLDAHFACVWALPWKPHRRCGAYRENGKWAFFETPFGQGSDHKADVLRQIAKDPKAWFPQLGRASKAAAPVSRLETLRLEEIVLVDDQRANFQSETGEQVLRYCKVARFDADYRDFGFLRDMGGIGAHSDADYDTLRRFVEDPWMCKDTFMVRCQEREFPGNHDLRPVNLVVFDFDETLTMSTFMPGDPKFSTEIGWSAPQDAEWTQTDLVDYNFESPWVTGSRVAKLRALLKGLSTSEDGSSRRTLALLSKNEQGVVAVLNLLTLAGLAEFFSALWTIPARRSTPNGAYREGKTWKCFDPPVDQVHDHKADVLHHVAQEPSAWFPQLAGGDDEQHCPGLQRLRIEGIVLVDDERANFRSNSEAEAKVLRYCKVARYDDDYRECGMLNQMGGIGAHSDKDYETLRAFVERPWEYPYENAVSQEAVTKTVSTTAVNTTSARLKEMILGSTRAGESMATSSLFRDATANEETERPKAPRIRKSSMSPPPHRGPPPE